MDERRDQRAGARVAPAEPTAAAPAAARPPRRARRRAARAHALRGQAVAAVSTVVVLGGLALLILTSPGWPVFRDSFFDPEVFADSFPDVLEAFWLDIRIFLVVEVVVLVLGLAVALVRTVKAPALFPLKLLAIVYTDVFRGIPTILLVYLIGFGVPAIALGTTEDGSQPLDWLPTDPIVLGGFALALSYGAYVAEVYRAGLNSIHRGQRDAALAIGLTERAALRHVIVPQAVRRVGPAAAQRLHRAAEGRRPDLDPRRRRGGVSHRADPDRRRLQLHAAGRRRAALPLHHDPDGAAARPLGARHSGRTR